MQVILSINAKDFEEARGFIEKATSFLPPESGWIHIDVADGTFTPNITWGSPEEFKDFKNQSFKSLNTEVHLMVSNIESYLSRWCAAGIQRIIVHEEILDNLEYVLEICAHHGVEVGIAIAPETKVEELNVYFNKITFYQILGVTPGVSGQKFNDSIISKIQFVREKVLDAIIEVDGGITPPIARACKKAGADIVVSSHYIWSNKDPKQAYQELRNG